MPKDIVDREIRFDCFLDLSKLFLILTVPNHLEFAKTPFS